METTGTADGQTLGPSAPTGERAARAAEVAAAPFATDGELTILLPERTIPLSEERRELVQTLLWLADDEGIVADRNANGAITSLRTPISAGKLQALSAALPILGLTETTAAKPETASAKKRNPLLRVGGWLFGEVRAWGVVLGTLIATLFVLLPDLKPSEPPKARSVTISNVAVEDWRAPTQSGIVDVISYDIAFEGYRGEDIVVEWAAFDAVTKQRLRLEPAFLDDPALDPNLNRRLHNPLKPSAAADRGSARFAIPVPRLQQCIFVRVYATTPDRVPSDEARVAADPETIEVQRLDYADSPPFDTHFADGRSCAAGATGQGVDTSQEENLGDA